MKIRRDKTQKGTHYEYPTPHYDAKRVLFGPVYEAVLERKVNEVDERNKSKTIGEEFIIVGVDELDASLFLQANGFIKNGFKFEATEIDESSVITYGDDWTEQIEKITDQNKVNEIAKKVGKGEQLTQEDMDALNPDKPEIVGIGKSKSFLEDLTKAKAEAEQIRADRVRNKIIEE